MPTVDSYIIQRSLTGTDNWVSVGTVSGATTTFSDTGLNPSTTYYYRVIAKNDEGVSAPSNSDSATTSAPVVLPPFGANIVVWLDPTDSSTMWQDVSKTTPVTTDGDPIAYWEDKSGNGNDWTQSDNARRPTWRTTYVQFLEDRMDGPDLSGFTGGTIAARIQVNTTGGGGAGYHPFYFRSSPNTGGQRWGDSTSSIYSDAFCQNSTGNTVSSWSSQSKDPYAMLTYAVTKVDNGGTGNSGRQVYVDGSTFGTTSSAASGDLSNAPLIGGDWRFNTFRYITDMDLYGFVLYDRALTAGEVTEVDDFFNGV